jgi:hypothetical protein
MDINFTAESLWPITRTGRKMRTTRGPGFTDLKVAVRLRMTGEDRRRFTHPFSSKYALDVGTALSDSKRFVPTLLGMGADDVQVTTSWWSEEMGVARYDMTYVLHFEGIGHAKGAESAEKCLEKLRTEGTLAARVAEVACEELDRVQQLMARDARKEKLSLLANGLVQEARTRAKVNIDYEAQKKQLHAHLARQTESLAMEAIAQTCSEYGLKEEDLRQAVEETLELKTLSLLAM